INPVSLRGSNTGVFVGAASEESRTFLKTTTDDPNLLFGTFLSMLPNQVSFAFDFHGPTLVTDTACSSSLVALHEAILNIRSGQCDAAIVAGVNALLDSDMTKRFYGLTMLSNDGNCKAFDISANGYVRSEAAVVVFICKESFARRSYAKVLHAKVSTDGSKVQGIFFPSGPEQEKLLREVYAEAGVDPDNVSYIEAHGTGTLAGDPQEVNAIDRFFCTDRHAGPLLIGSVKTNMGHSETASSLCGVAKIALVELLASIDIYPQQLFGHSLGEFSCAYVDGCYNIEETLLTNYTILKACEDFNLPPGAMASVGLRWEDNETLWEGIFPACHNAIDNMTVVGSPESVKELSDHLKGAVIFAREINSHGYAVHSDLMKPAEAQMMERILGLNLRTKTRSPKWISTSQSSDEIMLLSGRYFVNNILSPVLFHSAVERIPSHAVVIEIAPHGLFQTILRRSLHDTCVSISLTDRNQSGASFFLRSVGKLFVSGLQPKINQLYPKLEFPIRSAALPVSLLIQWDHKDSWIVADMPTSGAGNAIEINLKNPAQQFYKGYKINDHHLFPPSGFLILIWRILAAKGGSSWDEAITFDNIVFNRACYISVDNISKFICNIHKNEGFEILENGNSVVTGSVKLGDTEMFETEAQISDNDKVYTQAEVYDRFKETGYEFSGTFHSLQEVEVRSNWARTGWQENWFELLESLFQLEMFSNPSTEALLPVRIAEVTIDEWFLNKAVEPGTPTDVVLHRDKNLELVSCAGVQIRGLQLLPMKYIQGNSCNLNTNLSEQSLSLLVTYLNNQLAEENIRALHVVIDSNFIEIENRLTVATSGTNETRNVGVEFSGILFDGQKVTGLARFEATTAQLISVVYWAVPDTWSLSQAATVPVAYATAYYALIIRGTLKHYESILIHCGDEAVGEAAIAIALSMKCTVFTTIRAEENKLTLLKRFRELNGAKILSAGHCHNLEKIIHKETKGLGVNVVLNSLPDNLMRMSAHCIAQYGRFLQLMDGGFENPHNRNETTLGLSLFMKNVTFHGIRNVLLRSKEEDCKSVYDKVQVGIEMGIVKPLTVTHYEHAQLKEANWFQSRPPGFEKIMLELE
ncbi:unnamed protein product, partial [Allacma fusca]